MSDVDFLPRFNIAAVPVDLELHEKFFRAAQSLSGIAAGYCLGEDQALPHVTLCQFRAQDNAQAWEVARVFVGRELCLKNNGLYMKAGEKAHEGKFWIGYIAKRGGSLVESQAEIVGGVEAGGGVVLSEKGDDYFPHFTLVRAHTAPIALDEKFVFVSELMNSEIICRIQLGVSDENGQLLKILSGPS